MKRTFQAAALIAALSMPVYSETFRTLVAGKLEVTTDSIEGSSLPLSYVDSVVVSLGKGARFLRGIELELKVPPEYLKYRGSLAVSFYSKLSETPKPGVADLRADRVGFELIPNKLQTVYQIPLRSGHGLRASPYVSLPTGIVAADGFPLLFRIMPVIKGLSDDFEAMQFQLTVRPILGEEGAVKLSFRYPEQLGGRPFSVYIDDILVEDPGKERILKEGEHHLVVLSEDYRNESQKFQIERGKVLELPVDLQDPTPYVSIEAPENTQLYFDGVLLTDRKTPFPTEPGTHEIRFQVGDYSVVKPFTVQKGKRYRLSLTIDVVIAEND